MNLIFISSSSLVTGSLNENVIEQERFMNSSCYTYLCPVCGIRKAPITENKMYAAIRLTLGNPCFHCIPVETSIEYVAHKAPCGCWVQFNIKDNVSQISRSFTEVCGLKHFPVSMYQSSSFNNVAVECLNHVNFSGSYSFQHHANGGEKHIGYYWLDAYDEKRNLVLEFDGSQHYQTDQSIEADERRDNHISRTLERNFKPNARIFRYDIKNRILWVSLGTKDADFKRLKKLIKDSYDYREHYHIYSSLL